MDGWKAQELDKNGELYVDEDNGEFMVFGSESGFCYGSYGSQEEANAQVKK